MFKIGDLVTIHINSHNGETGKVVGIEFQHGEYRMQAVRRIGTQDVLVLMPGIEFTK